MEEEKSSPTDGAQPLCELTREGSLQPQWMQQKPVAATGGQGASQTASRPRFIPDQRGRSDAERWTHGDDNRGEETEDSKQPNRTASFDWREESAPQGRAPKWVPDERDTWKPKERWAAGPDATKRWVDAAPAARQRSDWTGPGEGISRSYGDRWNTEGGRWTEERHRPENQEYVPKNSRWNDEERGDRWRGGAPGTTPPGGSSVIGNGSGTPTPGQKPEHGSKTPQDRYRPGTHPNRRSMDMRSETPVESQRAAGYSISSNARFSKKQMLDIYDTLLQKLGSVLPVPEGADMTYPGMLRSEYESAKKTKEGDEEASDSGLELGGHRLVNGVGKGDIEADEWVYKDPEGKVQGPFGKNELIGWWEEGYFPLDLPLRSSHGADDQWVPLKQLLNLWRPPPGFSIGKAEAKTGAPAGQSVQDAPPELPKESTTPDQTAFEHSFARQQAPSPGAMLQHSITDPLPSDHIVETLTQAHGSWQRSAPLQNMMAARGQEHPFNKVQQSLEALNIQNRQNRRPQPGLDLGPQGRAGLPLHMPGTNPNPLQGGLQGIQPGGMQGGLQFGGSTGLHQGGGQVRPNSYLPPGVAAQMQGLLGQQNLMAQQQGMRQDGGNAGVFQQQREQSQQQQQQQDSVFSVDMGMEHRNQLGSGVDNPGLVGLQERQGMLGRGGMSPEPQQALLQAMRNQAQLRSLSGGQPGVGMLGGVGGGLARLMAERPLGPLAVQQAAQQAAAQHAGGIGQGWPGVSSGPQGIRPQGMPGHPNPLQQHIGLIDPRHGGSIAGYTDQRLNAVLRGHPLIPQGANPAMGHVGIDPQVPPPRNVDANAAPGRPGGMGLPFMKVGDQPYLNLGAMASQGIPQHLQQQMQLQQHFQLQRQQQLHQQQQQQQQAAQQAQAEAHLQQSGQIQQQVAQTQAQSQPQPPQQQSGVRQPSPGPQPVPSPSPMSPPPSPMPGAPPASVGNPITSSMGVPPAAAMEQKKVWGGAKPATAASLRSIQEQEKVVEQTRQLTNNLHSMQAANAVSAAPGPGRGAGWNVQHVQAKPLKDIMQETAQTDSPQQRTVPQGPNMAELSRSLQVPGAPWGVLPNRVLGPNIRDMIFKDKVVTDTGAQKEDHSGQHPPAPPPNAASQNKVQQTPGEGGRTDGNLWQHAVTTSSNQQQHHQQQHGTTFGSLGPQHAGVYSPAPVPAAAPQSKAPNSKPPGRGNLSAALQPASGHALPRGATAAPDFPVPGSGGKRPIALPPTAKPGQPTRDEGSGLFTGQLQISRQFQNWCQQQMMSLAGSDDMALVEFLLSLKGRTEVVEYIQEYFKQAPKERVANFTKEFMNRKDGDGEQLRREAREHGKRKKDKSGGGGGGAQGAVHDVMGGGMGSKSVTQPSGTEVGGWEQVGKNKNAKQPKPAKGKKPAKGQHMPAEMLGFRSNVNFDILYRGGDE